MIDIDNLQLKIGEKEVLTGIDLHLKPGDVYGLLGPNGAGKSTTIFALLGLRAYSDGNVRVLGADPADDARTIRRAVGVMPEKAGFYPWMTALDHIKWYGGLYGCRHTDRDVEMMLDRVGLRAAVRHPIGTYSRGMRQRLAVARALMPRPRLLILDEPTNGLDPKGRREIHDLLVDFAVDRKAGVLLCSHLLDDVERLCNRIGIIDGGRSRIEGSIADLLAKQGNGRCYRLRLEAAPGDTGLPEGVAVLSHEDDWWRVRVKSMEKISALWRELWQCGWKILEIRSEAASLEALYLEHVAPGRQPLPEVA